MGGRLTLHSKVVHSADQSLPEVVLPHSIHYHSRGQRARAVLEVRHPFRQGPSLLGGLGAPTLLARRSPIILGIFAVGEHGEESQLHRLAPGTKISPREQK